MRKLVLISGPEAGREFEIDRELIVGRGEADVKTDDEQMSRRHAALRPVERGVEIEDLGSRNGTFVDGERISAPLTIAGRSTVRTGASEFTVEVTAEGPGPTQLAESPGGGQATAIAAPPAPPVVVRKVWITAGPAAGQEFELDRELVVGRANADLTILDAEMSRRHATLRPVPVGVEVEDLGSMNGTSVDGERISGPRTITTQGRIRMGDSDFVVEVSLAEPAAAESGSLATIAPSGRPAPPAPLPPLPPPLEPLTPEQLGSLKTLARTRLFLGLSEPILQRIGAALQGEDFAAGATILREDDPLQRLYIVESGTVVVTGEYGGRERELGRLGPGDFFGEIALLHGSRSRSTIRAETATRLQTLSAEDFDQLMKHVPQVAAAIEEVARTRRGERLAIQLEAEHSNIASLLEDRGAIRIGRAPDNDLVVSNPTISRRHAVIRLEKGRCVLTDLRSTAGTFVNGTQIRSGGTIEITDGDEISVGEYRFVFDREHSAELLNPQGIRVDVVAARKEVSGRTLLHDVTLTLLPGELVAIVGGSGAGKTTLLDAMSGVRQATSGQVLYDGRDYYQEIAQYRHTLGYVPQDDILHLDLPLRLTLKHAARLRLARDMPLDEVDARVEQALESLGLAARADVTVRKLSGGQRKRASIGIELLSEPRVFYLDEPTSGLDPSTDRQMMELLRTIADEGRTVVLTTHATGNVRLCDKICVLARDGHLAFYGSPADALDYFDVEHFDEIYDRIANDLTPAEWGRKFRASETYAAMEAAQEAPRLAAGANPRKGQHLRFRGPMPALHQFRVLSHRNFDLARQPRNLMPCVMTPLVIVLMLLALFRSNLFSASNDNPSAPLQLVFTLSFMSFLFGLLFGVQQIVNERAIFLRERMVTLGIAPYLLSKTSFLAPLLIGTNILIPLILRATDRLPAAGLEVYVQLIVTLCLSSLAGLALALLISSIATSSQFANDLLAPWIAPQVLFAGSLFAITAMTSVGHALATVTAVRWSFEGAVSAVHMKTDVFANSSSQIGKALLVQYKDMFNSAPSFYWMPLAFFILVPLVLAGLSLTKQSRRR